MLESPVDAFFTLQCSFLYLTGRPLLMRAAPRAPRRWLSSLTATYFGSGSSITSPFVVISNERTGILVIGTVCVRMQVVAKERVTLMGNVV